MHSMSSKYMALSAGYDTAFSPDPTTDSDLCEIARQAFNSFHNYLQPAQPDRVYFDSTYVKDTVENRLNLATMPVKPTFGQPQSQPAGRYRQAGQGVFVDDGGVVYFSIGVRVPATREVGSVSVPFCARIHSIPDAFPTSSSPTTQPTIIKGRPVFIWLDHEPDAEATAVAFDNEIDRMRLFDRAAVVVLVPGIRNLARRVRGGP